MCCLRTEFRSRFIYPHPLKCPFIAFLGHVPRKSPKMSHDTFGGVQKHIFGTLWFNRICPPIGYGLCPLPLRGRSSQTKVIRYITFTVFLPIVCNVKKMSGSLFSNFRNIKINALILHHSVLLPPFYQHTKLLRISH